jgi:predicted nuclease of predicted toxin-antitoxin system
VKLLLDENLSPRLVGLLSEAYPGSEHVEFAGLGEASDAQVWFYAKAHGFAIVSKDSDFADMSVLEGAPPKVIWIKLGNCTTAAIAMLLLNSTEAVLRFFGGDETCLVLGRRSVK